MIKRFFLLLLLALVVSQFLRPNKNEASYETITSFETATVVPDNVRTILQNNCYDCHSNSTRYPWYMEVSPVSHWMAYHINEGKEHFNVSDWDSYTTDQKEHKLEELIEEIEKKAMPLKPYTLVHDELSNQDADILTTWAKEVRDKIINPIDSIPAKTSDTIPATVIDSSKTVL